MPILTKSEVDILVKRIEEVLNLESQNNAQKTKNVKKYLDSIEVSLNDTLIGRVWRGYYFEDKESHNFDEANINALVRILGYSDYAKYLNIGIEKTKNELSNVFDPVLIEINDHLIGEEILVGWVPIHYAKLKYLGDFKFEVIETSDKSHFGKIGEILYADEFYVDFKWQCEYVKLYNGEEKMVEGYSPYVVVKWKYNGPCDFDLIDKQVKIWK